MNNKESTTPLKLDYATPRAGFRRKRPVMGVIAATCGLGAAIFGVPWLIYGFLGVFWVVRNIDDVEGEDWFKVGMFLLIGAVCEIVAYRWAKSARDMLSFVMNP